MELTDAAQKMFNTLTYVTSAEDLATALGLAERFAKANGMIRIATVHIEAALERLADPMAPDYDALAEVEPTSQNGDSRDAAEVAGAQ